MKEKIINWKPLLHSAKVTDLQFLFIYIRDDPGYVVEQLFDRVLVRVSGSEALTFLQGLVTNDMDHLNEDDSKRTTNLDANSNENMKESFSDEEKNLALLRHSIYAMFLNNSGRIMFDVIIIHLSNEKFLIDCNIESAPKLIKHLKMYRVRKKIDISLDDTSKVWSIFSNKLLPINELNHRTMAEDFIGLGLGSNGIISTADPRNKQLGFRVFVLDENSANGNKLATLKRGSENQYKMLRYKLGVSECPSELVTGKALPLESNADYLHGISFHKGCYIGQELTARTHHTGVIRKRIMALNFISNYSDIVHGTGLNLENLVTGKSVGKLMGHLNGYGLGLVRVKESIDARNNKESIVISENKSIEVEVVRPEWWPAISPNKVPDK